MCTKSDSSPAWFVETHSWLVCINAAIHVCNKCVIHTTEADHHKWAFFSFGNLGPFKKSSHGGIEQWVKLPGRSHTRLKSATWRQCTVTQSLHMRGGRAEGRRADFTEEARGFIKIKLLWEESDFFGAQDFFFFRGGWRLFALPLGCERNAFSLCSFSVFYHACTSKKKLAHVCRPPLQIQHLLRSNWTPPPVWWVAWLPSGITVENSRSTRCLSQWCQDGIVEPGLLRWGDGDIDAEKQTCLKWGHAQKKCIYLLEIIADGNVSVFKVNY